MTMTLMTAMTTSISEVMETMFFLPVEFLENADLAAAGLSKNGSNLACRLSFSGEAPGLVQFLVPQPLILEMTGNFLGESPGDLTQEHVTGTLTEFVNMVCGNALSKFEENKSYSLGLPELMPEADFPDAGGLTIIDAMQAKMAMHLRLDE